jgi:integrase
MVLSTRDVLARNMDGMAAAFPELLRRFDAHLQAVGRAEATRATYRYELTRFWCDWCVLGSIDPLEATAQDVEGYLAALPGRGSKRADASRALKAFYGWASRVRGSNPAAEVVIPRARVGPAPHLDEASLRRLLRAAFRKEARRGWAIMLCVATGARIGSLVAVEPRDVDLDRAFITFRVTKGNRPYGLPLNRQGLVAARHLLGGISPGAKLTLVGVGAPGFRVWVHQAERDAGLERVWPHLLRHEFSNRVAAKGDPEAWRQLMNHADLSQWARYVAASDERLRAAIS